MANQAQKTKTVIDREREEAIAAYKSGRNSDALVHSRKCLEAVVKTICKKEGVQYAPMDQVEGADISLFSLINSLAEKKILSDYETELFHQTRQLANTESHVDIDGEERQIETDASIAVNNLEEIIIVLKRYESASTDEKQARKEYEPLKYPNYYGDSRYYRGKWANCTTREEILQNTNYLKLYRLAREGDIQAMLDLAIGFVSDDTTWNKHNRLLNMKNTYNYTFEGDFNCFDFRYYYWIIKAMNSCFPDDNESVSDICDRLCHEKCFSIIATAISDYLMFCIWDIIATKNYDTTTKEWYGKIFKVPTGEKESSRQRPRNITDDGSSQTHLYRDKKSNGAFVTPFEIANNMFSDDLYITHGDNAYYGFRQKISLDRASSILSFLINKYGIDIIADIQKPYFPTDGVCKCILNRKQYLSALYSLLEGSSFLSKRITKDNLLALIHGKIEPDDIFDIIAEKDKRNEKEIIRHFGQTIRYFTNTNLSGLSLSDDQENKHLYYNSYSWYADNQSVLVSKLTSSFKTVIENPDYSETHNAGEEITYNKEQTISRQNNDNPPEERRPYLSFLPAHWLKHIKIHNNEISFVYTQDRKEAFVLSNFYLIILMVLSSAQSKAGVFFVLYEFVYIVYSWFDCFAHKIEGYYNEEFFKKHYSWLLVAIGIIIFRVIVKRGNLFSWLLDLFIVFTTKYLLGP